MHSSCSIINALTTSEDSKQRESCSNVTYGHVLVQFSSAGDTKATIKSLCYGYRLNVFHLMGDVIHRPTPDWFYSGSLFKKPPPKRNNVEGSNIVRKILQIGIHEEPVSRNECVGAIPHAKYLKASFNILSGHYKWTSAW